MTPTIAQWEADMIRSFIDWSLTHGYTVSLLEAYNVIRYISRP